MNYPKLKLPALGALLLASLCAFPARAQEKDKAPEQEPQKTEIIDTTLVTVPVTVTDNWGRFIKGIKRTDFKVYEDGVQQEIESFSDTEVPFSVALLIDLSRSTKQKLPVIKKAALDFVRQLQPRDRVLIVAFSDHVEYIGDFSNDQNQLARTIDTLKSGYGTSLYDAVQRTIREKLQPLTGRKALVVLTDGVDTMSRQASYSSTLDLISHSGIVCYAVQYETRNDGGKLIKPSDLPYIGSQRNNFLSHSFAPAPPQQGIVNIPRSDEQLMRTKRDRDLVAMEYLRAMAFQSGATYLRAESAEMTARAFNLIADELRHQYTLAYYPKHERQDGAYHTITVSVPESGFQVRARQGYFAPKRERVSDEKPVENKVGGEQKP